MVTDVYPFRAIVLQCLLLTVSVAIESVIFQRRWRTANDQPLSPRQSVQYAASLNLLTAILGWFTVFTFFELADILTVDWVLSLETALLNFIFFNQYSAQALSVLIVIGFITFFVSFLVKQVGLWGLEWLLQLEVADVPQTDANTGQERSVRALPILWTRMFATARDISTDRERTQTSSIRDLRRESQTGFQSEILTILFANAYSSSASLVILIILMQFL
jgi:hypothetical protein